MKVQTTTSETRQTEQNTAGKTLTKRRMFQ